MVAIGKIVFWLAGGILIIGVVATITTVLLAERPLNTGIGTVDAMIHDARTGFRNAIGVPASTGQMLGRPSGALPQPADPSQVATLRAERLAAEAARHRVIAASQEVVMADESAGAANNACLGGPEKEIQIEVKNDIEADQIDVSYKFQSDATTTESEDGFSQVTKAASCGKNSIIKQCIPLPPVGQNISLARTAHFYETTDESQRIVREESKYLLLKPADFSGKPFIALLASVFQ